MQTQKFSCRGFGYQIQSNRNNIAKFKLSNIGNIGPVPFFNGAPFILFSSSILGYKPIKSRETRILANFENWFNSEGWDGDGFWSDNDYHYDQRHEFDQLLDIEDFTQTALLRMRHLWKKILKRLYVFRRIELDELRDSDKCIQRAIRRIIYLRIIINRLYAGREQELDELLDIENLIRTALSRIIYLRVKFINKLYVSEREELDELKYIDEFIRTALKRIRDLRKKRKIAREQELYGQNENKPNTEIVRQQEIDPQKELDGQNEIDPQKELDGQNEIDPQKELDGQQEINPQKELDGQQEINPQKELDGQNEIEPNPEIDQKKNGDNNSRRDYSHLWVQCETCYGLNYKSLFKEKLYICEWCQSYVKINSSDRIDLFLDPETWAPMDEDMISLDPFDAPEKEEEDSFDLAKFESEIDAKIEHIHELIKEREREKAEQERLEEEERAKAEQERLEEEERAKAEQERLEEEERARADQDRPDSEEEEREKTDQERLDSEEEKREKTDQDRLDSEEEEEIEKTDQERLDSEEEERAKTDQERLDSEEEERAKAEQERLEEEERAKAEQERLEEEERAKADQERLDSEEEEREKTDQDRLDSEEEEEREKTDQERLDSEEEKREKTDQERLDSEEEKREKTDQDRLDSKEEEEIEETYEERLDYYQNETGLNDAIQTGIGKINGIPVALGVMDFKFIAGSMGSVVGEKITRLIEYASIEFIPLIIVCASGGARMQEGSLSLMQMSKIASALYTYKYKLTKKLVYVSILTSPTTGGVTASFGMLGNVIISEPGALIAFAGQRVIEETLHIEVPEGAQETENLFYLGAFDLILPRKYLKRILYLLYLFLIDISVQQSYLCLIDELDSTKSIK